MTDFHQPIEDEQISNIMPVWKFCLLYIITFGIYRLPWGHKQWKFLKDKENLNINPWLRSLFLPFTIYSLAKEVFILAEKQGYKETPSAFQVTFTYWVFLVLSRLPDPFWLLSLFSFLPLLTILKAVNYYWQQEQPNVTIRKSFTGREVIWIVFGAIFWLLFIIGMSLPKEL